MFNFDKKTGQIIQSIAEYAQHTGICVYFVGGMVRDCLMGIGIKDIDILIEGSAIDFVHGFYNFYNTKSRSHDSKNPDDYSNISCVSQTDDIEQEPDIKIKSIHKSFNTAKTVINNIEIDFASTREEEYPKSGCLPVVTKTGCPVKDDLKRRDFTVNAIAARLIPENGRLKYEIIDPYFGTKDIKEKKLKALHNKSYIDDPTRILRGLDFILRFGFDFTQNDKALIEEYLKSPNREGLSIDRVKLTLKKLFSGTDRAKEAYLRILDDKYYRIWENKPSFKKEWAQKLYDSVEIFKVPSSGIFLGAIFENLCNGKPLACNISNYEIYNFYKPISNKDLALRYSILGDNTALFYFKKLKDVKSDITGEDLIKQGYTHGKELGDELKKHLIKKLNNIPKI